MALCRPAFAISRGGASCYHLGVLARCTAALCSILFFATACGGGGGGPTAGPDAAPSEPIVNVTARGFEPPNVLVAAGGRVRFQNFDDRPHSIASNPVDTHTDCPAINEVGLLVPGQVKATGALRESRTCTYHDELSEATQLLTGSITIR